MVVVLALEFLPRSSLGETTVVQSWTATKTTSRPCYPEKQIVLWVPIHKENLAHFTFVVDSLTYFRFLCRIFLGNHMKELAISAILTPYLQNMAENHKKGNKQNKWKSKFEFMLGLRYRANKRLLCSFLCWVYIEKYLKSQISNLYFNTVKKLWREARRCIWVTLRSVFVIEKKKKTGYIAVASMFTFLA